MYKVEIFTDQFSFASVAMIDKATTVIEQDFLAYDSYTIQTPAIECEKGYLVHITDADNVFVADGIVGDVKPQEEMQSITIRPLNTLFDAEVFYTPITDCISWLATNINSTFMNNADTVQNRPIHLSYTQAGNDLPLTGYNLHETTNLLSVMISALKTYGVVVKSRLDLTNSRLNIEIFQQSATKTLEASLANVLEKSVTIGDSYGSTNKAVIRKIKVVGNVTTVISSTSFYLHTDGTISTTNTDRIVPVFYAIENLEQTDDMSNQDWTDQATSRAKEILQPAKYDNEIDLQYDIDDLLATPMALEIGTLTTIYIDGESYASILTGKRIEAGKVTLIFGVTRTELTKQMNMGRRDTMTFENTVSATLRQVAEKYPTSADVADTYVKKTGDTMTGSYYLKSSGIDLTASPPASTQYSRAYAIQDTNGTELGKLQAQRNATDVLGTFIQASRTVNGTTLYNKLALGLGADGTRSVSVSSADPWLSALGLTGGRLIIGVQTITCSASASVADKASATCTGTRTNVAGASGYLYFPRSCNYGFVSSAPSTSGTTVTISATNASGASHTLSVNMVIIAYKTL